MSRNRGGGRYINNVVAAAGRVQAQLASDVRDAVTRFKDNPRHEDWD